MNDVREKDAFTNLEETLHDSSAAPGSSTAAPPPQLHDLVEVDQQGDSEPVKQTDADPITLQRTSEIVVDGEEAIADNSDQKHEASPSRQPADVDEALTLIKTALSAEDIKKTNVHSAAENAQISSTLLTGRSDDSNIAMKGPTDDHTEECSKLDALHLPESKDNPGQLFDYEQKDSHPATVQGHVDHETQPVAEETKQEEEALDAGKVESIASLSMTDTAKQPNEILPGGSFGVLVDSQAAVAGDDELFINHGLALWEQARTDWLGPRSSDTDSSSTRAIAVPVDVDEIIDVLFATPRQLHVEGGPRKFPNPVALPQMIDLLTDLWEAEGLDT